MLFVVITKPDGIQGISVLKWNLWHINVACFHGKFRRKVIGNVTLDSGSSLYFSKGGFICSLLCSAVEPMFFRFQKTHFPFQLFVNSILKDNYIRNSVSENLRLQLTPLTP